MVQMLSDLVVLAVVVRLILGAATRGMARLKQDRRSRSPGSDEESRSIAFFSLVCDDELHPFIVPTVTG